MKKQQFISSLPQKGRPDDQVLNISMISVTSTTFTTSTTTTTATAK
ncbi:MAG TPA: hypothetical protein P5044_00390 [bacterium]|nr:hypothetical protein [bacterium]